MPWDADKFIPAAVPETADKPDVPDDDGTRRHAARRFFHAAPPWCIDLPQSTVVQVRLRFCSPCRTIPR